MMTRARIRIFSLTVAAALVIVGSPFVAGEFWTRILSLGLIYSIAAVSLDLGWGYTGVLDLGHGLWFGIGALAVGTMTATLQMGIVVDVNTAPSRYLVGIVLGVVIAIVASTVVAYFTISRGSSTVFFISVVTLVLSTAVAGLYSQFSSITGGDSGIFGFDYPGMSDTTWYFTIAAVALAICAAAIVLTRSDAGVLMRAARDNDLRLRYLGGRVELVRRSAFVLGAALAALAGGLYGASVGVVSAELFGFVFATQIVIWVAVGGRATVFGPALGAVALTLLDNKFSASFSTQSTLVEGLLFVAVIALSPDGVVPGAWRVLRSLFNLPKGGIGDREVSTASHVRAVPAGEPLTAAETRQPSSESGDWLIRVVDAEFGYGALSVLRGVRLTVRRGELLCLVGPNGAGKSTLMGVISGSAQSSAGRIEYNLPGLSARRRVTPELLARAGLLRKFQVPELFPTMSIADALLCAAQNGKPTSIVRRTRQVHLPSMVMQICRATGVLDHLGTRCERLPHGVKQGLDIAMAVMARPQLLLLDEPTAGLSREERRIVGGLLRQLVDQGITCVLIEHDLDFVSEIADRVVVLADGRIVEDGPAEVVRESPAVREVYVGGLGA